MWNFGIPYRLKHYNDLLTQPGLAFSADAGGNVIGHAAGRTAIIVAAGALDTRPGSALGCLDHQAAYLEAWLSFLGATSIHVIRVMPTFGEAAVVDRAMETAYRSEEHTSELQSLMRISYAVFCLKKKKYKRKIHTNNSKKY